MSGLRILMYHVIGERNEAPARFVVPIGAFERQMAWLARLRFNVISLQEAVQRLLAKDPLPPRAVVLTFDDGTRDMLTLALPVLRRHGFPATAFIVTRAMGGRIGWTDRPGIAHREILTWDEALQLEPLVSLQPHTRTHPSLPKIDDDQLRDEVAGSLADLDERTGGAHEFFAYPYGHFDDRVAAAAEAAGYTAALSVNRGLTNTDTPRFEFRRYEIRGDESLTRFLTVVTLTGMRTRLRRMVRRP
jgi:peptidoglycan/xylan/chitin deacetylase (PgdA/CDA1 family)